MRNDAIAGGETSASCCAIKRISPTLSDKTANTLATLLASASRNETARQTPPQEQSRQKIACAMRHVFQYGRGGEPCLLFHNRQRADAACAGRNRRCEHERPPRRSAATSVMRVADRHAGEAGEFERVRRDDVGERQQQPSIASATPGFA